MGNFLEWYKNSSSGMKLILYIVGTIILGCVGSGLWVKVAEPLSDKLFDLTYTLLSHISQSYFDSLFYKASFGFQERSSNYMLMMVGCVLYIFTLFYIDNFKGIKFYQKNKHATFLPKGLLFIISLFLFFTFLKNNVVNGIITTTLSSIEIVRPYVGDEKYVKLRSEFHQMRDEKDYRALYDKLKAIEAKNGVKLKVSNLR